MEYILSAREMKEADERTSREMHVSSAVLMERAALAVADVVGSGRVLIVAGLGNNGGDGFAAGRILMERGADVDFCLIGDEQKCSPLEKEQLASVKAFDSSIEIMQTVPKGQYSWIIDAIFGISLNREVGGIFADAVEAINKHREDGAKVISIDIPSGIEADSGKVLGCAVKADITIACAFKKPGELLYPGADYVGELRRADIGITERSITGEIKTFAPDKSDAYLPARRSDSNKGTYGKVLVIAGSEEICGAAILSASAALRSGCGMVRVYTHENNRIALQTALPEALVTTYMDSTIKLKSAVEWCDIAVIGPGLGTSDIAKEILEFMLKEAGVPLVIDADALNMISKQPELLKTIKAEAVITPHVAEMSRLCGQDIKSIKGDPIGTARDFAETYHVTCVLKDARTVTAIPGGATVINTSGNDGMATAGSGDVLTGIIASLAAQGEKMSEAAWRGVYLHGLAGDSAKEKFGAHSMTSSDIIDAIYTLKR